MKLATLDNGTKDGALCVVDRTLSRFVEVSEIAPHLQYALDHHQKLWPKLIDVYEKLNANQIKAAKPFVASAFLSPLPRAYQWADGSAYVNHVELVRKARQAAMPPSFWVDPLIYQGGSDGFLAPTAPILVESLDVGVDFEAEVAVITDDVKMACSALEAKDHILLIMLVNDVSFRELIPSELAKGFGFFQSKPASSFSPVAITPDELQSHWRDCKVHLPLISELNGQRFGAPNAGVDMTFSFAELIAHAAKTRALCAGTIIGSGTVSNVESSTGSSCIAEKRMLEILEHGAPETPYMQYGDTIKIYMNDPEGQSLFGAIFQTVQPYSLASSPKSLSNAKE